MARVNSVTHCQGVRFEGTPKDGFVASARDPFGFEELPSKWASRFPLTRCLQESQVVAQQMLIEGDNTLGVLTALPVGYPNRSNRQDWYPKLARAIDVRLRAGMSPMDAYRDIARRKRVPTNRVKQWAMQSRRLAEGAPPRVRHKKETP